jgi:hypothetical protein
VSSLALLPTYGEVRSARAAKTWKPVEINIEAVRAERTSVKTSISYWPRVEYAYVVQGRRYTGSNLGFLVPNTQFPTDDTALARARELSHVSFAYFNPQDPSLAVLSKDHDFESEFRVQFGELLTACLLAVAIFVGAWVVILGYFRYAKDPDYNQERRTPDGRA